MTKPSIFTHTIYRIPTNDELKEVNDYNLTAQEIINGLSYTIIGRGIKSKENIIKVTDSIKKLISLFPDNKEYKKALNKYSELNENKRLDIRNLLYQYIHD